MECVPALRDVVVNVAWPLAFSVPVPSMVVPSRKFTVPLGVPVPGAVTLTVAVKVTHWPKTGGLGETVNVVGVALDVVTVAVLLDIAMLPETSPAVLMSLIVVATVKLPAVL